MKGIHASEHMHPVNILAPRDIDTVATPRTFTMKNSSHVSIILQLGVTGAAVTVTVEACNALVPTAQQAIPFAYRAETTAGDDTLGPRTEVSASGFATSTNDVIMYVIEIDAAQLPEGFPCLRLVLSDPAAVTFGSAVALLSGLRAGAAATAIA